MGGKMIKRKYVGTALVLALAGTMSGTTAALAAGRAPATTHVALASTPTHLVFRANGTPNLTGLTFAIGNAAGSAHIGDTNVNSLVRFLKQWGANASQTNASQNSTELAVAGGQLVSTSGPLPTEVDAGLMVYGPNQVHLDDELLVKKSIKTLKQLKGTSIAYCCGASPDGVMLSAVLHAAKLKQSQIHLLATGASASSLNALIAGQVDGAFTAASGLPASVTTKFRAIATATSLLPAYADSYMAARPAWLRQNPAMAEAIDLAWLASAKLFNANESAWVQNAAAYTSHADPTNLYQEAWHQLKTLNGWPLAENAFDQPSFTYNLKVSAEQQALSGAGTRPAGEEITLKPWTAAWTQFAAHKGAY